MEEVEEKKSALRKWIKSYLIMENFPLEHLIALCHIIGLFNDCRESEKEIFEFAERIYKKYAA